MSARDPDPPAPLRVLILEDSVDDADVLMRELRQGGFDPVWKRFDTPDDFAAALQREWDVILSDYSMPHFNALGALEIMKRRADAPPFIILSGTIGEEVAVEAMRAGANDFFLKSNLTRLVQAIRREVEQGAQRRERRRLEESNSRLSAIVEGSDDAIISKTLEGVITSWNKGAEKLYGYPSDEAVGRPIGFHIPPERAGEIERILARIRAGKSVEPFETVRLRKDGTRVDVSLTVSPIRDSAGEVTAASAIAHDVTERRQAALALAESEVRLRVLMRASDVGLWDWNLRTNETYFSPEWKSQIGYEDDEISSGFEEWQSRVHPDDIEGAMERVRECTASPLGRYSVEFRLRHKDGTYRCIQAQGSVIRDDRGDPVRLLGCHIDVTERKATEAALRESEARLERVLSSSPTISYLLKVKSAESSVTTMTWISDNVERVLGYSLSECLAPGWWADRVHPDDRSSILAAMPHIFEGGQGVREYRFRHAGGGYRWMRDDQRLLPAAANVPGEIVGAWSDITDRKALEEQFRQAQKMEAVGRLAGGIAHDFNNLMMVVQGVADVMHLHAGDAAAQERDLDNLRMAAQRGGALTRQILAFSRPQVPILETVNVGSVVRDLSSMIESLIGENIRLSIEVASDAGEVRMNRSQLEQIVMNLVVNGRDAMPSGGRLTIEVDASRLDVADASKPTGAVPSMSVVIAVSDNGTGMSPEVKERIFEPFFTTKEAGRGTGLGLATVYGIVKGCGGDVRVHSEPGRGAVFEIYLPRAEATKEVPRSSPANAAPTRGVETVFLVEDDSTIRQMMEAYLEGKGYRVFVASNGTEALALLETLSDAIHVLVTDVVVSGNAGLEIADAALARDPKTRIIFTSGYADSAEVGNRVVAEGPDFLQKPFELRILAERIRAAIDRTVSGPGAMGSSP